MPKIVGVDGFAIALLLGGGTIVYAGVKGYSIAEVARSLIQGRDPSNLTQSTGIKTPVVDVSTYSGGSTMPTEHSGPGASFGSNNAIANAAAKYAGQVPYVFGGGNPRGWDCSGFVNYVLGHDLGMTLPMGVKNFQGNYHGPVVANYCVWSGAVTVPRGDCQAGDIVCYGIGHMGIALGPNSVINAYDTGHVTQIDTLDGAGYQRPILVRRVIKQ